MRWTVVRGLGLSLLIAGMAGCAQSGSGLASLTAPSAAGTPGALDAKPDASYDGSGTWHVQIVITDKQNGQTLSVEGDIPFTQDASGNLHALVYDEGNPNTVTMKRRGAGRMLSYEMSIFEPHANCNTDVSGPAQIDTTSNTLHATLNGTEQGCIKVSYEINGTKNVG